MVGHDHKSGIFALNIQITTALVSIFLSGCVLIIVALLFLVGILDIYLNIDATVSLFDYMVQTTIILGLVCLGFIMILIGLVKSLILMGHNTKLIDKLVQKRLTESLILESPTYMQSPVPSAIGGNLRMIRPEVTRSEAKDVSVISKPSPVSSVPSVAPVKSNTPSTSPSPTPTSVFPTTSPTLTMTFDDALQSIITRYNTEKVKKTFQGWVNTLMMTFPDVGKSYLYKINGDQGILMTEGVDESAAVQVKMDSTIFIKMLTKQINPIKAYSSGSLEVKGEMKNMLKLRGLMF
jgi:putative sterol carrier protein